MTFKIIGEFVVLFFALWVFGAEFFRDVKFYLGNGFDLDKQRQSNFYNGYIVKLGNSTTAKSRFFFWYPAVLVFCVIMTLDILGIA